MVCSTTIDDVEMSEYLGLIKTIRTLFKKQAVVINKGFEKRESQFNKSYDRMDNEIEGLQRYVRQS